MSWMFARTNLDILVQVKCKAVAEWLKLSSWKKLYKIFQTWYRLLKGIIPYLQRRLAGRNVNITTNVCKPCLVIGKLYLTGMLVVKFSSLPSKFCQGLIFMFHKNGVISLLRLSWNWYLFFINTSNKKKLLENFLSLWTNTILLYDIAVTNCHSSRKEELYKKLRCDQSP